MRHAPPSRTALGNDPLTKLVREVERCSLCPRMEGRTRVLGPANGTAPSGLLFVAEAPGRLGADRSRVPLHGDQTGRNFEALLGSVGLDRGDAFITNAVLCNPRDEQGRNATPSSREVANCSMHLRATIEVVRPKVVVSLGRVALEALGLVAAHGLSLSGDVGRPARWDGRWLVPLYHPGPRARVHRPLESQLDDFAALRRLLDSSAGLSEDEGLVGTRRVI